jgi:hypothetical protein
LALALTACGGSDNTSTKQPVGSPAPAPAPTPTASTITIDFNKGIDGWTAGVADYHDGTEPTETGAGWSKLPVPFTGMGYYMRSHNNSDDVFTFAKRQFSGLVPNAKYTLTFEMSYATSAPTAAWASAARAARTSTWWPPSPPTSPSGQAKQRQPLSPELRSRRPGRLRQAGQGAGPQGIDGLDCGGTEFAKATRKSDEAIAFTADKDGKFWIVLGTDSAFEGTNDLYLLGAVVNVKPQ